MTNSKLAIVGVVCLAAGYVTGLIAGNSFEALPLYIALHIAGLYLLVLALLRSLLAQAKVTGLTATVAAGCIMVLQFPFVALLPLPEILKILSGVIAVLGVITLVVAAVYWLRTVIAEQRPRP
jgi:hypothetical protein